MSNPGQLSGSNMKPGDKVEIRCTYKDPRHGRPSFETEVLSVEGDVATVSSEYTASGEARYSIATGRRLKDRGDEPQAWDLWRLRGKA